MTRIENTMDSEKLNEFIQEQRKRVENSGLPLKDIRVVDLGAVVAAPFAATMLGDFGAEVIKVEPREVPDAILSGALWRRNTSLIGWSIPATSFPLP